MPSFNSAAPSFFFLIPAWKAGSKSFASFTLEPGLTRNGSINRAIRFVMSSAIESSWLRSIYSVDARDGPQGLASAKRLDRC
jgi:hypothetical protein